MAFKFRSIPKVFYYVVAALYPVLVYFFLVIHKTPSRVFSLFVIAFALFAFVTGAKKNRKEIFVRSAPLLFGLGLLCLITDSAIILKFYPLLMNIIFLAAFGITFFSPPSMIFRFATIMDKSIIGSLGEKRIKAYCRKVTLVWCIFFVINGSIAAWTIFSGSDVQWSVYNGGISYILMGILFAGEFIIRKIVQKIMPSAVPLSAIKNTSRPLSTILCYEDTWNRGIYKTWGDFLEGTARLRRHIELVDSKQWLLHCEDCWYFLLALTALLQCKKEILLSANIGISYINEIRGAAPFLTDQVFAEGETPPETFHIPALVQSPQAESTPAEEGPAINADETSIIMYTSGSTGEPKAVRQRLTEFENDNRFILSKWGEEFLKRKICSTVSQHHIFGLLFSILLPFTAGVPFRREKIQFPDELEKLTDTEYMIITVPAFLKRAVEIETPLSLHLKSPWIFTSGGAVSPETAQKTKDVFGFWPLEVYGSTETSGIAWRQSINGPQWTVFDNAQISQTRDGCLIIRSPYIKDKNGFETAHMVEILEDGRFLLRGRIDSVVKIEEKRISLPEMESRIVQSGLAADVCVIPMEDKRQYLAAAIALNKKGKERFAGLEKHEINKFWREYLLRYFENVVIPKKWRYLDALPLDTQGKKKRESLKLLFSDKKEPEESTVSANPAGEKIIEKTENSIHLEFSVPDSSPYFDGHFPGFPILPAVAQMDMVLSYASKYLGTGSSLSEIQRIKFSNLVRPSVPLLLKLEKSGKSISFSLSSVSSDIVYSSGKVILGDE